jgi:hypothetical protein
MGLALEFFRPLLRGDRARDGVVVLGPDRRRGWGVDRSRHLCGDMIGRGRYIRDRRPIVGREDIIVRNDGPAELIAFRPLDRVPSAYHHVV